MSEKTPSNRQRKQRRCNSLWRPQAATGLPIQSSRNRGAAPPSNPFRVAQGGHHSLALSSLFHSPFAIHPLCLALAGAFGLIRKLAVATKNLF
jgi:hypothetical protein